MTEKIIFYGSLAYNVLMSRLHIRHWYDRIDQHVLLGCLPLKYPDMSFPRMLVQEEKVRAVISLNEDFELRHLAPDAAAWRALGVQFLQLPTRDYVEVPSMANLQRGVAFMTRLVAETPGAAIYVHCKAGRTRSATLVACYLVHSQGLSPEQAVGLIRSRRPHIYLRAEHLEAIRQFSAEKPPAPPNSKKSTAI